MNDIQEPMENCEICRLYGVCFEEEKITNELLVDIGKNGTDYEVIMVTIMMIILPRIIDRNILSEETRRQMNAHLN